MPLISGLGRQRQADLWVWGQSGVQSKQPCLKKTNFLICNKLKLISRWHSFELQIITSGNRPTVHIPYFHNLCLSQTWKLSIKCSTPIQLCALTSLSTFMSVFTTVPTVLKEHHCTPGQEELYHSPSYIQDWFPQTISFFTPLHGPNSKLYPQTFWNKPTFVKVSLPTKTSNGVSMDYLGKKFFSTQSNICRWKTYT